MIKYRSFWKHHTEIIIDALEFTKEKVIEYYEVIIGKIGESHRSVIEKKNTEVISEIIQIIEFLNQYPNNEVFEIDKRSLSRISNVIRSALKIYTREISKVADEYSIEEYKNKISEIEKILQTEMLKDARTDIFEKYYEPLIKHEGKVKLFISYSSRDKKLANRISDILTDLKYQIIDWNIEAFLAHRDIPMSKEWRDEILKQLESCSVLLALYTTNYICSTYGNQKVGIAIEKGKRIIPIFFENNQRKFGFLEAIQGLQITKDYPEGIVEIVGIL